MTWAPQKEYIITEDELQQHMQICVGYGQTDDIGKTRYLSQKLDALEVEIRSRPATTSAGKVLDQVVKAFDKADQDGFANMWRAKEIVEKIRAELRAQEREPSFYENERERTHP